MKLTAIPGTPRSAMTLADAPDVLTVRECASLARTGPKPIYRAVATGELYGRRIGRDIRIPKRAFVAWLEGVELDAAVRLGSVVGS